MNEAVRLSLVIPVHDQFDKLSKALTSALAALRYFEDRWELIVVDDASSSDVGGLLPSDVILLRNPARLGFGPTANRGMAAARGEFCCLLNSDMYVDTDFFVDFLSHFSQADTIAVCAAIEEPDGTDAGLKWLNMGDFGPTFRFSEKADREDPQVVPYANGGGSFFRRRLFLELGGFDDLFAPYYWEDADFGFRAWKKGYASYYSPKLRLKHDCGTSSRADPPRKVKRIKQRNRHLFHWLNFTDIPLGAIVRRFLLPEAMRFIRTGKLRRLGWLFQDFTQIGQVVRRRQSLRRESVYSDVVVLERLGVTL